MNVTIIIRGTKEYPKITLMDSAITGESGIRIAENIAVNPDDLQEVIEKVSRAWDKNESHSGFEWMSIELDLKNEVKAAVQNAPESTETTEETYAITSELIGDCEPATVAEITEIVNGWETPGWQYAVEESGDELRIYAYRKDGDESTPSRYTDWQMVTDSYGYIVAGELIAHAS